MAETERLVSFTLLGQEYQFYTGSSEQEMDEILHLVRRVMEESGGGKAIGVPANKIAVLSCLNMASRYLKLKQEFSMYREDTEKRLGKINNEIAGKLHEEKM